MKPKTEVSKKIDKALHLASIGQRLFGLYSPDNILLSVHLTEKGAEENKNNFERNYKIEGYYVDYVILHV
jgi:hypothetical protein